MSDRRVIIPAGTVLHSLSNGKPIVTVVGDFTVGDYLREELFDNWAGEKPGTGDPISRELMDALTAMAFAHMVRTGIKLCRMDTGEPLSSAPFAEWRILLAEAFPTELG